MKTAKDLADIVKTAARNMSMRVAGPLLGMPAFAHTAYYLLSQDASSPGASFVTAAAETLAIGAACLYDGHQKHLQRAKDDACMLQKEQLSQLVNEQTALLAEHEQAQTLFREFPERVLVLDIIRDKDGKATDYRYVSVNPEAERAARSRGRQPLGQLMSKIYPELGQIWKDKYAHVANTGESANFEAFHEGQQQHLSARVFSIGKNRIAIVAHDETQKHQALQELSRSHNKFRTLVENLDDVVFSLDADGLIKYIAPTAEKQFGYNASDVFGTHMLSYVHPDDLERASQTFAQRQGTSTLLELRVRSKDGQYKWIRCSGRSMVDETGQEAILGTFRDITAEKIKREEERRREEKERQEQRLTAIGELAGGVAHDINNQLAPIGMAASMIQTLTHEPEVKTFAGIIEKAVVRSAQIVKQLNTYACKGDYVMRTVDLAASIDTVLTMLEHTMDKRIQVERKGCSRAFTKGDASYIENMLLNLAINARDAMPSGGVLSMGVENVEVRSSEMQNEIPDGKYVRLSVSDTGIGIPPEIMPRIFEPFFTTKGERGTGKGLATVYGIVKQHNGCIRVNSSSGRGARFDVYLPSETLAGTVTEPADNRVISGRGRILIADDD